MAWLEVRQGIDRGVHTSSDLGGGETWPGLRWHINIRTWMELRHCLEGGVMWLHGPGLGWDSTCMEVRLKSLNPDPDEIGPEWRWDTYLESLMGLWGCLYGAEMQFWCPGWGWDVTWMEMRSGLGSIPFFQFNSNSNSVIFNSNSNSNSTTRNKFQFQFQFQFQRFQFQFQFQFQRFEIPASSIREMTCWCLPWN